MCLVVSYVFAVHSMFRSVEYEIHKMNAEGITAHVELTVTAHVELTVTAHVELTVLTS